MARKWYVALALSSALLLTACPTDTPDPGVSTTTTTTQAIEAPDEIVREFILDIGFTDPIIGEFQQGDNNSGEVEVRSVSNGPVTTVLVRKDETGWYILGAHTANIILENVIVKDDGNVLVEGQSTAFEGTINVTVREDGTYKPLASWYVMGGSNGEMGPFSGTFILTRSSSVSTGYVVAYTVSAEDGRVWEASVYRIRFYS